MAPLTTKPTRSFRFIHTADLHLDSPLRSLALRDPALAEQIKCASRITLQRIVDLSIAEKVDALLIAGDLYDGDQKSMHTAATLSAEMRRLEEAAIPVFMIRGNHDAQSPMTAQLMLPENVHVFGHKGDSVHLSDHSVAIHGVSFQHKHAPHSLLPRLATPTAGCINIGLLHTSLAGSGADNYAPCSLQEVIDHGYDYWALGHVHKRRIYATRPAIVMPGIPQGRDMGEAGACSISLVTIYPGKPADIIEHTVGPAQFERIRVDVTGVELWSHLADQIELQLHEVRAQVTSDHVVARLHLVGKTPLSYRIIRDHDVLLETARDLARGLEQVWIEQLTLDTASSSDAQVSGVEQTDDAIPELEKIITDEILGSADMLAIAERELQQLLQKMPPETRHIFGQTLEQKSARLKQLLVEGSESMLAQLQHDP